MTPATTDAPLATRRREWVARNPLRVWRTRSNLTLMDASSMLGVGISTVQSWENGARVPSDDHVRAIAKTIGDDPTKLTSAWDRWHKRQPRR